MTSHARSGNRESGRPGSPADAARWTPLLFIDRTFGPFFWAKMLSNVGMWVHSIAAAIVVYQLTRSAFLVGMVSVAQFAPPLLLTPWAGVYADRGDRRRQLVLGRCVSAIGVGSLAVWIVTFGLDTRTGAAAVILTALISGLGIAIGVPAEHALIPALVRPTELQAAVALNAIPLTVARTGGPALGAFLVATTPPATAFALAASLHLLFVLVVSIIPIRNMDRPPNPDHGVLGGLRYLRQHRWAAALIVGVTTIGIGSEPVITLMPAIAEVYTDDPRLVGVLASSFGGGAGLAFFLLAVGRRYLWLPRLGTLGLLMLATSMGGVLVSPTPTSAGISLAVGGVGMTFALTSMTTLLQQRVPEALRGRMMALWAVAFLGSRPLAAAATGGLADAVSLRFSLATVVLIVLIGALISRPGRMAN